MAPFFYLRSGQIRLSASCRDGRRGRSRGCNPGSATTRSAQSLVRNKDAGNTPAVRKRQAQAAHRSAAAEHTLAERTSVAAAHMPTAHTPVATGASSKPAAVAAGIGRQAAAAH